MQRSLSCPETRRCPSHWVRLLAATLALALGGCSSSFRVETVLLPDGAVKRAICQPRERTPGNALDPKTWTQVTFTATPDVLETRGGPKSISELPIKNDDSQTAYFAAWGDFDGVDRIPDHLDIDPPDQVKVPKGKLIREYSRNDYGLLVEHRWSETLTDCVKIDDMRRARKELARLVIEVGSNAFNDAFGNAYDSLELRHWFETEGAAWFDELVDMACLLASAHEPLTSDRTRRALAAICERHGLRLTKDGRLLEEPALTQALNSFAIDRLTKTVKTHGDHYLSRDEASALLDALKDFGGPSPFGTAVQKEIADHHGGKEAFDLRFATLVYRVFGLYWIGGWHFNFTLECPGEVVETNGELAADNRVRWRFEGIEAFPFGFAMTCRSLDLDAKIVALPQGKVLKKRETMLRFVNLVAGHERLIAALRECRGQSNFTPLVEYRRVASSGHDAAEEVKRVYALYDLFKISAQ